MLERGGCSGGILRGNIAVDVAIVGRRSHSSLLLLSAAAAVAIRPVSAAAVPVRSDPCELLLWDLYR